MMGVQIAHDIFVLRSTSSYIFFRLRYGNKHDNYRRGQIKIKSIRRFIAAHAQSQMGKNLKDFRLFKLTNKWQKFTNEN